MIPDRFNKYIERTLNPWDCLFIEIKSMLCDTTSQLDHLLASKFPFTRFPLSFRACRAGQLTCPCLTCPPRLPRRAPSWVRLGCCLTLSHVHREHWQNRVQMFPWASFFNKIVINEFKLNLKGQYHETNCSEII